MDSLPAELPGKPTEREKTSRTGNYWEFSAPAKGVIELNQTVEQFVEQNNVKNNTIINEQFVKSSS